LCPAGRKLDAVPPPPACATDADSSAQHRAGQVYRWLIRTPVRNYYGESDEAIRVGIGRLAMDFQRAMGNATVEAISAGADATHRGTYARSVPAWKTWFDSLAGG